MSPNVFLHTFLVLIKLILDAYCISISLQLQTKNLSTNKGFFPVITNNKITSTI